jgi:hypothetical protein
MSGIGTDASIDQQETQEAGTSNANNAIQTCKSDVINMHAHKVHTARCYLALVLFLVKKCIIYY